MRASGPNRCSAGLTVDRSRERAATRTRLRSSLPPALFGGSVYHRQCRSTAALACIALLFCVELSSGQEPGPSKPDSTIGNELDAFMAKVLARREVNLKTLEQYV